MMLNICLKFDKSTNSGLNGKSLNNSMTSNCFFESILVPIPSKANLNLSFLDKITSRAGKSTFLTRSSQLTLDYDSGFIISFIKIDLDCIDLATSSLGKLT
jgi:hypothetical protein